MQKLCLFFSFWSAGMMHMPYSSAPALLKFCWIKAKKQSRTVESEQDVIHVCFISVGWGGGGGVWEFSMWIWMRSEPLFCGSYCRPAGFSSALNTMTTNSSAFDISETEKKKILEEESRHLQQLKVRKEFYVCFVFFCMCAWFFSLCVVVYECSSAFNFSLVPRCGIVSVRKFGSNINRNHFVCVMVLHSEFY